jgi:hypothetical protein
MSYSVLSVIDNILLAKSLHIGADLYASRRFSGTLSSVKASKASAPPNSTKADDVILICPRAKQPLKAELPIEVQEDKSPTLVREEQTEKAQSPIEVQEDKSTLVRALQLEKA